MMARRWTESGDTAVRLAAALDYEDGGQRLRELAARLDRTQAGLSGGARRACARPSSRATSRDHGPSGGRDERRRVTPVPADGVGDGAHYVVTTDEQRRGRAVRRGARCAMGRDQQVGPRVDDAGDLRQNPPAEFLASHRESTALGVGQANTSSWWRFTQPAAVSMRKRRASGIP